MGNIHWNHKLELQLGNNINNLIVLGKPAGDLLRENQITIDAHIKHAAGSFDESGLDVELILQGGRQTGSLGKVISLATIGDADLLAHNPPLRSLHIMIYAAKEQALPLSAENPPPGVWRPH